ncbi:hypothetical protein CLUG_00887 [Clavispora lusitaniae ATCC 42720]|uniref:Uncharacterized protein n=1 Tax=Clavispora lusitaniae (strain ATCC 42720) TaxID=306902 RepID=C4XY64_CLAL4|nr:uncharacterized protein CLUG_00887 [Clavispora lusitaniae ATCC 42720]EEQ36763.1 hypothetical protein CLUG_00887 [Clavispora lusitaniae ATCC 42720]
MYRGVMAGNSSTPLSIKNPLNPRTPMRIKGSKSSKLSGTKPPQKATSTQVWSRAAAIFWAKCAAVVVGGTAFNGMSTTVVTPPAAAACVPEAKPSHSVRPGSFKCTCASTKPGMMTLGDTSRSSPTSNRAITSSACRRMPGATWRMDPDTGEKMMVAARNRPPRRTCDRASAQCTPWCE